MIHAAKESAVEEFRTKNEISDNRVTKNTIKLITEAIKFGFEKGYKYGMDMKCG